MKTRKQKPSKLVLTKYPYEAFLIHKEQRHTDALVERVAKEILNNKKERQ